MDRRHFLRLSAAGAAGVTALGLPGCSAEMPAEAIAAWRGPGSESDARRWVLAWAVLAPHSHNLQSWLVDLSTPDELVLYVDRSRLLPQTDPFSRQILMSQGTFVELLDLAARERGLRADITLFPAGEFGPAGPDDRPVARVALRADATVDRDPLFAQIPARRTNRSAYELARPVAPAAWDAMAAAARAPGLTFGRIGPEQAQALARHRAIAAEAWRIELTTSRTILESHEVLRIGAAEVAKHRDGLTMLDPKIVLLSRLGLFDRAKAPGPDDYATRSQIEDFGRKLDSTPGFLWITSAGNDRRMQVLSGRAYARVQLAATAHGVAMQPLSQALQEYPEQAGPYAAVHRLLDAPQPAHTVQIWARAGFAPAVDPAPRRGVQAHILPA